MAPVLSDITYPYHAVVGRTDLVRPQQFGGAVTGATGPLEWEATPSTIGFAPAGPTGFTITPTNAGVVTVAVRVKDTASGLYSNVIYFDLTTLATEWTGAPVAVPFGVDVVVGEPVTVNLNDHVTAGTTTLLWTNLMTGDPIDGLAYLDNGDSTVTLEASAAGTYTVPFAAFADYAPGMYPKSADGWVSNTGTLTVTAAMSTPEPPEALPPISVTTGGHDPVVIPIPGGGPNLIIDGPDHGDAEVEDDGHITYTPDPGYTGPDHIDVSTPNGPLHIDIDVNDPIVTPEPDGPGMNYATPDDVEGFREEPNPTSGTSRMIRMAARLVYAATITGVYTVDTVGAPSDPNVKAAFRDATCAQVDYWISTGIKPWQDQLVDPQVMAESMAGASTQYAVYADTATKRAAAASTLCAEATLILTQARIPNLVLI